LILKIFFGAFGSPGGSFSFLNLLLYPVEKYYGRDTAIHCSKVSQIDIERNSQSAIAIFAGQKGREDEIVNKAQALIERHPIDNFAGDILSDMFGLSRRNFNRRFLKTTGNNAIRIHAKGKDRRRKA